MPPAAAKLITPDESTTGKHVPALDGLRGVAILLVLFCHLFWSNSNPTGGALVRFFAEAREAGWIGVDLFFVLSGFLITGILYDTRPAAGGSGRKYFINFYARRSLRIFPLYFGFVLLLWLLTSITGYHWSSAIYAVLTYTQNLNLFHFAYFCTAPWAAITQFWSLAVEEHFYLVWPLVIFLLRTRRKIAIAAIVGASGSMLLRFHLYSAGWVLKNHYLVSSWTPARLDGLLIGGLLALAIRSRFHDVTLAWARPVLAVCSVWVIVTWYRNSSFEWATSRSISTYGYTILAFGFAALLATALRHNSITARVLSLAPLRFFGRYSYGLYVYHMSLAGVFAGRIHQFLAARTSSKLLLVLGTGIALSIISTVVAWLSFHLYENRFLLLKGRFASHSPRPKLQAVA